MEEERAATAPQAKFLKAVVAIIAIAMSLYHMYVAGFGPPEAYFFRGTHLLFTMTLDLPALPVQARWRLGLAYHGLRPARGELGLHPAYLHQLRLRY